MNANTVPAVNTVNEEQATVIATVLQTLHPLVARFEKDGKVSVLGPFMTEGEDAPRQWATIVERAVMRLTRYVKVQEQSAKNEIRAMIEEHCLSTLLEYEEATAAYFSLPEKTRRLIPAPKDYIMIAVTDFAEYCPKTEKGEGLSEGAIGQLLLALGYKDRVGRTHKDAPLTFRVPVPAPVAAPVADTVLDTHVG
jgi:hypothetical protein